MKKRLMIFVADSLLAFILTMIAPEAEAMTFYSPEELGFFAFNQVGGHGYIIKGATKIKGAKSQYERRGKRYSIDSKGIATFGSGPHALSIHYNAKKADYRAIKVGAQKIENTIDADALSNGIFRINTDSGITLYALKVNYGSELDYIILGFREDGKVVKYIDTKEIALRYFQKRNGVSPIAFKEIVPEGDTLVLEYRYPSGRESVGELRCKWDDTAKWFGVEKVDY